MSNTPDNSFFNSVFIKERQPRPLSGLQKITSQFNYAEKLIFAGLAFILAVSGVALALEANASFLEEIPAQGGTLNEGLVGSPRFLNPLLAVSETDKAIVSLVYSGLLKHDPATGDLALGLASSYEISPDGLIYSVKMREDITFHDGKQVTADDVIFTIEKALDPIVKSPKRANWEGVTVEKVDNKTINFILKKPYSPFVDNLTLGILPRHIWKEASAEEFPFSQWNIEAVGSGPYKVSRIKRSNSGIPTYIELSAFKKYSFGRPYISKLILRFFRDETELLEAWEAGSLDGASGISPKLASEAVAFGGRALHKPMSRVFGAFFNQNKAPVLANAEVRKALDASVDKKSLVSDILLGFGTPLAGPVPENVWSEEEASPETRIAAAQKILLDAGWKPGEDGVMEKKTNLPAGKAGTSSQRLAFTISTGNVAELKRTAEIMHDTWERLGAEVEVKIFESADLNRDVIRPRNYEVLLFGESLGHDMDLYPFWHSSQRIDPGLNISLYTNINADKLIEEVRTSLDAEVRKEKALQLYQEISKDVPAVFTYTPDFIYLLNPRIKNVSVEGVSSLGDRFAGINSWYIETDKVWEIFANN